MRRKVKRWIASLDYAELDLLHQLLTGEMLLLNIHGEPYAVKKENTGYWRLVRLHEPHVYRANLESCTCQDSRFRARVCKHVEAVKRCLL